MSHGLVAPTNRCGGNTCATLLHPLRRSCLCARITARWRAFPPAYIEPQEIDILHDEAVTYAEALTAAGITVQLNEVSGSYHGFDAESDNAFVSRVIQRRLCAMKTMLESSSRQPRP